MANNIVGKVWSVDTSTAAATAIITSQQVCIHSIRVRFTTAAAGSLTITAFRPDMTPPNSVQEVLLDLKTTAASTAVVWSLDEQYLFGDQTFPGLVKTVSVNVDTIYVVTGNPR